ncbi:AcetylCholine Receptor [Caenorhabditis elegans]|uniref:AcetylCholine Receptor n=1 Tax=Caenorhabditis elegans TaxID=6239 RepID=H2KML9_CAEEL|nr:AcetylCholine Receptor [Caenorhabditis elegans]CCE71913.1 AcetylCholine Receptor [Caenorhabditis elegans]|eukprot:NP_001255866.1 AcetylCholine Receptor [Caenorhabditis elegans]
MVGVVVFLLAIMGAVFGAREALMDDYGEFLPHIRLAKDLTDPRRYDSRVRPVMNHSKPTTVSFSMSLYQILSINEKQQNVDLNVWAIQKWNDDFLGWNPYLYGMINTTILPFDAIWLPDTYLYNSVVMNREETERYINVVVTTNYWKGETGAEVKFMYPALYRTSCLLDIRFFPYDQQACKLTISSWTSSKSDINYEPEHESVNMDNFLPNEEWVVVSFNIKRVEEKFVCCPEPWVLLEAVLVVRRKPLYYIVNLVIPTSVITLVAVTGFFTAASTSSERREKLSLGIDSLLAMSILMMMVSEQMPTSSDFVPLFGIFYLSIIFIIFIGTLFTAFILNVHLQKMYAKPVSPIVSYIFFGRIAQWLRMRPPTMLLELWNETGVTFGKEGQKNSKTIPKNHKMIPKVTSSSSGLHLLKSNSGSGRAPLAAPISARSYISMDDMKREAARRNWRRLVAKINSNKQNGVKIVGGGERGQLRQANRKKMAPSAISVPHGEPGPLMLSASAISAFSVTGDSTILESKLKRRYALEWEYLASVLDRVLLIVFSLVVFAVTSIMILVGEAMHLSYELAAKEL